MDLILPYKVGDLAESKCFLEGYRGAWFRCQIVDMRVSESGHYECYLDYIDYPGESKEWIRLFQKNTTCSEQEPIEQIMLRPSFPRWYFKGQVPEQFPDNDVIAVVYESWKVGDMVDLLSEGCYWSGKITKLLNENMVQVELLRPPLGEGQCYDAHRNDLRPKLDWSLVEGWTVPPSQAAQAKGKGQHVVCVIHRSSIGSEGETSSDEDKDDNGGDDGDIQDVQLHVISSNARTAPGSPVPQPSTARIMSGLNSQKDATLTSTRDLRPSSTSKSQGPTYGAQLAVSSSLPGIGIIGEARGMESSTKQEQASNVRDEYLQKLDEVEGRLREISQLERLEGARSRTAVLASLRRASDISEDAIK